jgi:hypothetical protein
MVGRNVAGGGGPMADKSLLGAYNRETKGAAGGGMAKEPCGRLFADVDDAV